MPNIDLIIPAREIDLGGFTVKRVLPYVKRRMVGPFIFFDQIGPAEFAAGKGIDVRPHPHIGLATVTYLFAGEIIHRDSLGSLQAITPGAVNWMTAGSGIVHSERTGTNERARNHPLHGIQTWVALPKETEECKPEFFHHPADSLPEIYAHGVRLRVIAGSAYGQTAPVKIHSPMFYVELRMEPGSVHSLPAEYSERAVYTIAGEMTANNETLVRSTMTLLPMSSEVTLTANSSVHAILLGGEPLSEPRHIYWNFVSSSPHRIELAKQDWLKGRFGKVAGDEAEFIPLPDESKPGTFL